MALNGSGPISLAGATTGESIAVELGESATGIRSLNDTIVRDLAEVASGAITMPTNFWGKSVVPAQPLYTFGQNTYGALGLGDDGAAFGRSSPTQVGAETIWSKAAGGQFFSMALKTDGTVWAWGKNDSGQVGDGTTTDRNSPVQVGALTTWSDIASIYHAAFAIKTDGTMWSWGRNNYGQLGLGDTTYRSSPVQIGALTTWSKLAAGGTQGHRMALKTDGTIWTWGYNNVGQLGDGTTTYRSSPIQVGALTTWLEVACGRYSSFAIKTDGTLYAWGYNYWGMLGLGNTINRSSPVQVGALTTWSKVASGGNFTIAIKTDGTIWTIGGYNAQGQLGQGDTTPRSSPVQIGALTTWSEVSSGGNFTGVIKTDGTLWAWGTGNQGQLGQNNTTDYSSPVQVGGLTTWLNMAAGSYHAAAITTD